MEEQRPRRQQLSRFDLRVVDERRRWRRRRHGGAGSRNTCTAVVAMRETESRSMV
jgi:hypothetical protein